MKYFGTQTNYSLDKSKPYQRPELRQARGTNQREPRKGAWPYGAIRSRSGTGLSSIASAAEEAAIPRCLQRFVRRFHFVATIETLAAKW